MPASPSAKRIFSLLSCVSFAGAVLTVSSGARAADACIGPPPSSIPAYKPALSVPGACTDADLDFFAEAYDDVDTYDTYGDIRTALAARSAKCAACVFTKAEDAKWGPIVFEGPGDDDAFEYSYAYFEKGPGGSATCADTVYKAEYCIGVACEACDPDDEDAVDQCIDDALGDAAVCGKYDYEAACPNVDDLIEGSFDVVEIAAALCGGAAEVPDDKPGSSSGAPGEEPDDGMSSGTGGGKKKGSSGGSAAPEDDVASSSGCAQGPGSAGGSIASALVLAAAVGAAVSRRRRARS